MQVSGLSVTYAATSGEPVTAIKQLDLTVHDGEFVSIIGPSGCGKSTLLYCMGGLLTPSKGTITVDGRQITSPDPRLAAFVFQDYTLLPWKKVAENASLGLRFAGASKDEQAAASAAMLELVGLSEFSDAYPSELSGGMQQRVAVARALCMKPGILLMDEPFGALDEQTRRHLGLEMVKLLTEASSTVVMVTHSLDEAIVWADRIIIFSPRPGRIIREIRVDEPRPRGLTYVASEGFARTRRDLFEAFESVTPTDEASMPSTS
jgi:NitT/TauT family transport system ATP-binding protein